jgi:hypothetical protein
LDGHPIHALTEIINTTVWVRGRVRCLAIRDVGGLMRLLRVLLQCALVLFRPRVKRGLPAASLRLLQCLRLRLLPVISVPSGFVRGVLFGPGAHPGRTGRGARPHRLVRRESRRARRCAV